MHAVSIVRTGTANIASVQAALERLGLVTRLTSDPDEIRDSPLVVLPGVGSFSAGMRTLREAGLVRPLRERIVSDRPTLGICLGMQLFASGSDESPGVKGIGVLPGRASAFDAEVSTPQLGWNRLDADPSCRVLRSGDAYYANSYKLGRVPPGWVGGMTSHGRPFVGAIERGRVVLCQFHPELSGSVGAGMLSRWVEIAECASC